MCEQQAEVRIGAAHVLPPRLAARWLGPRSRLVRVEQLGRDAAHGCVERRGEQRARESQLHVLLEHWRLIRQPHSCEVLARWTAEIAMIHDPRCLPWARPWMGTYNAQKRPNQQPSCRVSSPVTTGARPEKRVDLVSGADVFHHVYCYWLLLLLLIQVPRYARKMLGVFMVPPATNVSSLVGSIRRLTPMNHKPQQVQTEKCVSQIKTQYK